MIAPNPAGSPARGPRLTRWRWAAALLTLALVGLVLAAPLPAASWLSPVPQERHILVTARTFEFAPAVLRVNRGDTVVVRLDSVDVVHGLYVDGYGISTQAEPGQPGELRFVADRSGAFHFRCAVPCGNLHPFMIGKLVVEPNLVWLRGVAASLIVTAGALAVFWRS